MIGYVIKFKKMIWIPIFINKQLYLYNKMNKNDLYLNIYLFIYRILMKNFKSIIKLINIYSGKKVKNIIFKFQF